MGDLNIAHLRSRYVIFPGSFTATLKVSNNDDDDVTVPGAQRAAYDQTDVLNYGPVGDNANRTVFLLPCTNVVDSDGAAVTPRVDNHIVDSSGDTWAVNAVTQTLKGTWWRCIVSKMGR